MRTITFSSLYPNSVQPRHGIFVEQRLRHLLETGEIESHVVAPVPWFPWPHPVFGHYSTFARVPWYEERYGIPIYHPRYPRLPKVGLSSAPLMMATAVKPVLEGILERGFDFDLIDAHYVYPDGVAAVILGEHFGKPVVMSMLGDDVITYPRYPVPRWLLLWAVDQASGVTSVCEALKRRLVEWGAPEEKVRVVLQGVDLDLFQPVCRDAVRQRLGLSGMVLLSVGHATPRKGHHLAIEALRDLSAATLLIAGDGWYEGTLRDLARSLGVADRVCFLGHVEQEDLKDYYSAADALVLASSREGMANVLLESMACGLPVIATAVWGTPEAVTCPAAGVLMGERTAPALVAAARRLFDDYPDRAATRRHAAGFTWERTNQDLMEVLRQAVAGG
ncbi:MAG: teichuronic acid biosynthesis glycosyltransferase TuaC [Acidobacteriota bacterium]|jgi:glycosyltransferase involved in cell wall biosynthesis|nr:teichuronic acid biosynthesis glycosyltransferase TuaC [Acidobacteriota bacterium]